MSDQIEKICPRCKKDVDNDVNIFMHSPGEYFCPNCAIPHPSKLKGCPYSGCGKRMNEHPPA